MSTVVADAELIVVVFAGFDQLVAEVARGFAASFAGRNSASQRIRGYQEALAETSHQRGVRLAHQPSR